MRGALSIQVQAFGRRLIVAGGPTIYVPTNDTYTICAIRMMTESSSWKTSTILVNKKSQAWRTPLLIAAPQTLVKHQFYTSSNIDFTDGTYDGGYSTDGKIDNLEASTSHYRAVVYLRNLNAWIVLDRMQTTGANSTSNNYTQVWNFPPVVHRGFNETLVSGFEDMRKINTSDLRGPNIELRHFGPANLSYRKYFGNCDNTRGVKDQSSRVVA